MWPRVVPAPSPALPWYEEAWDQYQTWINQLDPNALVLALLLTVVLAMFVLALTQRD